MKYKLITLLILSVFLLSSASAFTVYSTNYSQTDGIAASSERGIMFWSAINQTITSIIKDSRVTNSFALNCLVVDNSTGNGANGIFSGDTCVLSPSFNMTANNYYKIIIDDPFFARSGVFNNTYASLPLYAEGNITGGCSGTTGAPRCETEGTTIYDVLGFTVLTRPGEFNVTLNSPENGLRSVNTSQLFNASATFLTPSYQNFTFRNSTFLLWRTNGTIYNRTFMNSGGATTNTSILILNNISAGYYTWNWEFCSWNGTASVCSLAPSNYSYGTGIILNNQTYNSIVYETSYQNFSVNVSTSSTILSVIGNLIYNGTTYSGVTNCTGAVCIISRSIDIPVIPSIVNYNYSFYWNIQVSDGSITDIFNSTVTNQTVQPINLSLCSGPAQHYSLNFTAYDEQNLTRVNPYSFQATFGAWLGTGSTYRNFSFDQVSVAEAIVCINPSNLTYRVNADILYGPASGALYDPRNYYLRNASITNTTQSVPLYLLEAADSTSFILQVLDQNSLPVSDVYIYINRYYPGNNTFATVQIARTDSNGKTVAFLQTETVEYQFLLVKNGQVLLLTDKRKVFPESSPFTLTFRVGGGVPNLFSTYNNVSNLQYLFSFNRSNHILTYTYIDTTGLAQYGRLQVDRMNPSSGAQTVCNQTVFQSSASITCDLSAYNGTFIARGYLSRSPEVLVGLYNFVTDIAQAVFSVSGLILGFIIILAVALATIYNPIVQIIAVDFTIIALSIIGILSFSPIAIFGILAVSTIVIIILRA